jgi:uncharacterized protein with PIN domain
MTKRKSNPFERIKQYYVEDKDNDIYWWINEDGWEEFKDNFQDFFLDPKFHEGKTREINGKQYNEWLFEQSFGEFEGTIVDADCPECGHLLVKTESEIGFDEEDKKLYEGLHDLFFCSDCTYRSEDQIKLDQREADKWEAIKNAPEKPKFRVPGQTLEEFINHYKFDKLRLEDKVCVVCKKEVEVSDFYRTEDHAVIIFKHEGCTNSGPAIFIPQGKNAEQWKKLFS